MGKMCFGLKLCEIWIHAISGSLASVIAMTIFYPLETLHFRNQVILSFEDNKLLKHSNSKLKTIINFSYLYKGLKNNLISLGISNFIYFYTFHGLRLFFQHSVENDLMLTFIAGVINVLLTTPLWVVNGRLKLLSQSEINISGLVDGLIKIAKNEGVKSLWSGLGPSLILVSNPAIQLTVYEALKRFYILVNPLKSSSLEYFLIGAISKVLATVITYPLQLAQTGLRVNNENKGMITFLVKIFKINGPFALYKGLDAKLIQTVLTTSMFFVFYEKIIHFVSTVHSINSTYVLDVNDK